MNEDLEAQRIGKAYAAQHITVEDLAYEAQGKAKQAKAKKPSPPAKEEPLTIKEETVANELASKKKAEKVIEEIRQNHPTEPFVPAHSAADRLAAAIKERAERGWLFCGNDMELEVALNRAAEKEKRLNIVTRNAMTPAPKPKKKRATPLEASDKRLADLKEKLAATKLRRDGTNEHITKLTQERPYANAEREVVIKGALEILRSEQITNASKVSNLEDDVRMEAEQGRKYRGEPAEKLTELQKREAAWRETQKITRVR